MKKKRGDEPQKQQIEWSSSSWSNWHGDAAWSQRDSDSWWDSPLEPDGAPAPPAPYGTFGGPVAPVAGAPDASAPSDTAQASPEDGAGDPPQGIEPQDAPPPVAAGKQQARWFAAFDGDVGPNAEGWQALFIESVDRFARRLSSKSHVA